jgi:hypothetical protein
LATSTHPYPVALKGRIKVKITNENGPVQPGDYLTSSGLLPGYAMKATRSGVVIGQVLEGINFASSTSTSTVATSTVMMFVETGWRNINNTFVLGDDDGQLANATATPAISSSTLASSFLINQKGSGSLLQLQQNGENRLLISNDGSINILANATSSASSTILSVSNATTSLFSINAVGDVITTGHIIVGTDTAGTATIKAGDNQTEITFKSPYLTAPKVIISVNGLPNFFYGVATKTPTGFVIQTSIQLTQDTTFDWIAIDQPQETASQSSLNLTVVSSPSGQGTQITTGGSGATDPAPTTPTDPGQVSGTSTPPTDTTTTPPPAGDTSTPPTDTTTAPAPAPSTPDTTTAPSSAPAPDTSSAPTPADTAPATN